MLEELPHRREKRGWGPVASCGAIVVAAVGVYKMDGPDPDGCDARLSNPITIVTCPVTEAGQFISDKVFGAITGTESPSVQTGQ